MKIPEVKTKNLLKITDLSQTEIFGIFEFTKKLKDELSQNRYHYLLKDKTLAMIFEKSSTRTRVSFETGMFQLGGHALFLSRNDLQLGRGETVADTAQVMSRYCDLIMIRTFSHSIVEELAKHSSVPVINGLTDSYHPCQNLTDYYTIYEREPGLKGIKLAYIGDGNNMANSLLLGAAVIGVDFAAACPRDYFPDSDVIQKAKSIAEKTGANIKVTESVDEAVQNAKYLYTDVWASMGQEDEAELRRKALANYKISAELMKRCDPEARVMHCLPAHRGEEIDDEVMDSDQSIVFDQAENRMHVQKAIMCALALKG